MYMCVCARIYVCMHKLKCIYIYASILYLCIYPYTKGIKLLFKVIEAIIIQNNNGRYLSFPLYCSSQDLTRKLWICKTSYQASTFCGVGFPEKGISSSSLAFDVYETRETIERVLLCFITDRYGPGVPSRASQETRTHDSESPTYHFTLSSLQS